MKKTITILLVILAAGCSTQEVVQKIPIPPVVEKEIKIAGFWLDEETGTVHKIINENGQEKVVSIIKYKDGNSLEVMKVISSQNRDGKLHWIYFVPSTKYVVELTTSVMTDNKINIEWKNRSGEGEEDSGKDVLLRCSETGISSDKKENEGTGAGTGSKSDKSEKYPDEYINETDLSGF